MLTKPVDDARGATALGGQSYHHHRPPYSYSQQAVVVAVVVFVVGISRADTGTLGLSTCLLLAIHSLSLTLVCLESVDYTSLHHTPPARAVSKTAVYRWLREVHTEVSCH